MTIHNTIMNYPLTLRPVLERVGKLYGRVEVISRLPSRQIVRSNWGEVYERAKALARALTAAGMKQGDCIATMMWNHKWHLEAYFGLPVGGFVLQTLNLRLHPDELAYIANHAKDRVLIVDDVLLPSFLKLKDKTHFERVLVVPTTGQPVPEGYENYEDFIAPGGEDYEFPILEENAPASLSYTSGTTGLPKGVVSSHRSMVLHTMNACSPDCHGLKQTDCVLPAVTMFHVNAWGIPYCAAMAGAKIVLPGQYLDGESLLELLEKENVTKSAGVPTIWMSVVELLEKHPGRWKLNPNLRIICGGSAVPKDLMRSLARQGVTLRQAWGMTETGPLATMCEVKSYLGLSEEERLTIQGKQGLPLPLIEIRVIDDDGKQVKADGKMMGELQVRGPWVAASYYNSPDGQGDKWTPDGWLRTGDIVTVDSEGYLQIADRSKDLIKSGGEWISSVDLENSLCAHPAVREAAVVAVPHPKWQERPVAAIVLKDGANATPDELRDHLAVNFGKWQLPDAFIFVDEIPHTSVGKIKKARLREMFASIELEK